MEDFKKMTNDQLRQALTFQMEIENEMRSAGQEIPTWFADQTKKMMTEWSNR